MKVAEFLELHDLTGAALSKALGYTGAEAVNQRRRNDEDIPEHWLPKLAELGYDVSDLGYVPLPPVGPDAEFRADERPPQAPVGAPQAPQPVVIDYGGIAEKIGGMYSMAGTFLVADADPLLAEAIVAHAEVAGQAWAAWIQSEPRVAAWLQKMMVGTPLGEVIFVHVGIVFSYTLARSAAKAVAADVAAARANGDAGAAPEAAQPGTAEPAAPDFVA